MNTYINIYTDIHAYVEPSQIQSESHEKRTRTRRGFLFQTRIFTFDKNQNSMEQTTINLLLGFVRSSGAGVDVKLMVGSAICPHAFAYLFLDMATLEVSELLELITQPSCIQMFSAFVFFAFFPCISSHRQNLKSGPSHPISNLLHTAKHFEAQPVTVSVALYHAPFQTMYLVSMPISLSQSTSIFFGGSVVDGH